MCCIHGTACKHRYNSNSLRGMRVRSLGSFGSELVIEDFRDRFFTFFYHLAKGNSTSLICKGTLVFTGALGRGNMTTILDDPPTDHLMGGAMIGLSRFTWRFSGLNFYWVSSLLMSF